MNIQRLDDIVRHQFIMDELSKMWREDYSVLEINGYRYCCRYHSISDELQKEIADRGHYDEIVYAIKKFNEFQSYCGTSGWQHPPILCEYFQIKIAERQNYSEISTFIQKHGFMPSAQVVFLKNANHYMRLEYVRRHGFCGEALQMLWDMKDVDALAVHLHNHGLPEELLKELFKPENEKLYYEIINRVEFPVRAQQIMVRLSSFNQFLSYIEKYGLWEATHRTLIDTQDKAKVVKYVQMHHYLSYDAEDLLFEEGDEEKISAYLDNLAGPIKNWSAFEEYRRKFVS